jgi:hypothetical protein
LQKPLSFLRKAFPNKIFASLRSSAHCRSLLTRSRFFFGKPDSALSLFGKAFVPSSESFSKQDLRFVALVRSLLFAPYSLPVFQRKTGLSIENIIFFDWQSVV